MVTDMSVQALLLPSSTKRYIRHRLIYLYLPIPIVAGQDHPLFNEFQAVTINSAIELRHHCYRRIRC